mgnify:FL=1
MNVNIEEVSQNVYEVKIETVDPDLLALAVRAEDAADSAEQSASMAEDAADSISQLPVDPMDRYRFDGYKKVLNTLIS